MTKGTRIRLRREELNLSQTYVADKIKIKKQTLYKYENNIISNIPSDKIEALAKVLKTTASYLMGWSDEKENDLQKRINPTRLTQAALKSPDSDVSQNVIQNATIKALAITEMTVELISYYNELTDKDKESLIRFAVSLKENKSPLICEDSIEKKILIAYRNTTDDLRFAVRQVLGVKGDIELETESAINE